MDGFLVLGQCGMDNVPMQFVSSYNQAKFTAENVTREEIVTTAGRVLKVDVSMIVGVAIVPFKNGVPQEMEYVKDIDEEDA